MREIITQDIERTDQEYDFFTQKQVKDSLISILFLWSKENPEISYKQGMNEVLAIIVFAFFAERIECKSDYDSMNDEQIVSNEDDLINFLFDSKHTFADIYAVFNKILQFGL